MKTILVMMISLMSMPLLANEDLKGSTTEVTVSQGLLNPYMPNITCNYNTQKLWYDGSVSAWKCVPDRTK